MRRFSARSTACEIIAGHDLKRVDAIVTGGASGIGTEPVMALALAKARVVIATRDNMRDELVAETLRKETGSDKIEFRSIDLASLLVDTHQHSAA
jgi:NAD(P)-dependent dehydrogenase (short-subunit alcohol dehydrogenase family)